MHTFKGRSSRLWHWWRACEDRISAPSKGAERLFWYTEMKWYQKDVITSTDIHGHRTLKAPHPVRSAQLTRVPPS